MQASELQHAISNKTASSDQPYGQRAIDGSEISAKGLKLLEWPAVCRYIIASPTTTLLLHVCKFHHD
jgi:hypothetical protein